MDLFDYQRSQTQQKEAPLASRMRPVTLADFFGQEHILGEGKLLRRAIAGDRLHSMLFYGPPGSGKTTLAKVIASTTQSVFVEVNATTAGVKDIKNIVTEAQKRLGMYQKKTVLFIDEIHRFNKLQQDALLSHVENGTVILIGATTENPFFEVNSALLSRLGLYELKPLTPDHIRAILLRALSDSEKGLGRYEAVIQEDALSFLADIANGDARTALNALELAVLTTKPEKEQLVIDLSIVQDCVQRRAIGYDKDGNGHYDVISAFIKSIRGSDPDAALYYLARMLDAGEDPRFIARRIVISASEDVGNADPHALQVAASAAWATTFLGMPECRIPLAQAVTYLAAAPKSNAAYLGIDAALADVRSTAIQTIPPHLQDASYGGAKRMGHGIGYLYPHDYPGHYVRQDYLPKELLGRVYYHPTSEGVERKIQEAIKRRRET